MTIFYLWLCRGLYSPVIDDPIIRKVTRITVKFNDLKIIRNTTKCLSSYFRVPKALDHLDSIENLQPRRSYRRVPSHCVSSWNPKPSVA